MKLVVRLVTAEMLGLFVNMHNKGAEVVLLNPSEDVKHVVEVTKLNTLLDLTGRKQ